jgi:hypothetical protein
VPYVPRRGIAYRCPTKLVRVSGWHSNFMSSPVESIVTLGETQLQIQMVAATGVDTIAVGVLGVDAALAAVVIAVNKELFGHLYWQQLIALAGVAIFALTALIGGGSLGLAPQGLYDRCKGFTAEEVDREVIAVLDATVKELKPVLTRKKYTVAVAILALIATVVVTVLTDVKI